jgi:hypothetical protein
MEAMERAAAQARQEGHLAADVDERQITFEIHGLILVLHYEARFLHRSGAMQRAVRGFDNILARYAA